MNNENFSTIEKKLKSLRSVKPERFWKDEVRALLVDHPAKRNLFVQTFAWKAALSLVCLITFLLGTTGILAAQSLPGEPLYGIKRAYEKVRLAFAKNNEILTLNGNYASKRIHELKQLAKDNNQHSTLALTEVQASVSEIKTRVDIEKKKFVALKQIGQNPAEVKENLTNLVPAIEEKQQELQDLATQLPAERQVSVARIISNLEEIKSNIQEVTIDPEVKGIETNPIKKEALPTTPSTNQ